MTLIAFYFAVISLASSLFFNQVEAWHGPLRSFQTSLEELKDVEQWRLADEQRKPIEAAAPNLFAALVGLLVLGLTVLAFLVPVPPRPPFDPLFFLRLPLAIVVVLFWGLGLARLIDGHRRLGRARKDPQRHERLTPPAFWLEAETRRGHRRGRGPVRSWRHATPPQAAVSPDDVLACRQERRLAPLR